MCDGMAINLEILQQGFHQICAKCLFLEGFLGRWHAGRHSSDEWACELEMKPVRWLHRAQLSAGALDRHAMENLRQMARNEARSLREDP